MSDRLLRTIAFVLLCSIPLTALSGCGEAKKAGFVMRTFSTLGGDADSGNYREIISEYSKEHGHVVINDTSSSLQASYTMGLSLASTYRGSGSPDVIYYSAMDDMSELSDFFMTVDEIRKEYPDFASNVSEAALNSAAASDGGRYCIPVRGEWRGIVINAALFRKSGLNIPTKWEDIVRAARHFENSEIFLFANSLDDSAALMEYMVRGLGGLDSVNAAMKGNADENWSTALDAVAALDGLNAFPDMKAGSFDGLVSPSELRHTQGKDKTPTAVELFNSGRAAILLIDNSVCGLINSDIDTQYISLPQVGSFDYSYSGSTSASQSNSYPSHPLSGPVYPKFTANTLPDTTTSSTTSSAATTAPSSTTSGTTTTTSRNGSTSATTAADGGSQAVTEDVAADDIGLYVNFAEGFYITKRAYYNKVKREDVLDFVECFLREENAAKLCCSHQAPSLISMSQQTRDSLTGKSNIYNGVIRSVSSADKFILTTQVRENDFFWNRCAMSVSCLSKGIVTKKEALRLICDPQLTVSEIYAGR